MVEPLVVGSEQMAIEPLAEFAAPVAAVAASDQAYLVGVAENSYSLYIRLI